MKESLSENCSNESNETQEQVFFCNQWGRVQDLIKAGYASKALVVLEDLAAQGYSEAYVEIGNIYEKGTSSEVPQDFSAARKWYMRAVEEGADSYGHVGLARLALNGFTVAGSASDALRNLETAADSNNPVALTMLGTLYHSGVVIPKDLVKAAKLYKQACALGYVLPMVYLSKCYWELGRYWPAVVLRVDAFLTALRLVRKDRDDPRLWNCVP
jgi:TPR repeat protein